MPIKRPPHDFPTPLNANLGLMVRRVMVDLVGRKSYHSKFSPNIPIESLVIMEAEFDDFNKCHPKNPLTPTNGGLFYMQAMGGWVYEFALGVPHLRAAGSG